jgi:hypothetical protein
MKSKIDTKKWAAGNVLYMPAEDQLWVVKGFVKNRTNEDGIALISTVEADGVPHISLVNVGPASTVAPARRTVLIGRL